MSQTTTDNGHVKIPTAELVAVETPADAIPEPAVADVAQYADITAPPELRPVIPEHLQTWAGIKSTARLHFGRHWHRTRYHGLRSPAYLIKTVIYALKGSTFLLGRVIIWWHATNLSILESLAVARGTPGHADAMKAHTQGLKTRSQRGKILAGCAMLAAGILTAMAVFLPWWAWIIVGAAAVLYLARYGEPPDKPIIRAAVLPSQFQIPTPETITRALASLNVPGINAALKDDGRLRFVADVHKDGPGWATRIELPKGVTAVNVIDKRAELASGLQKPLSATWPLPVNSEHPGMLDLWIGYVALNKQPPVAWPYGDQGVADLFKPVPFGADQRGNVVTLTLMFMSVLIGAMPRMGKTFALRVIALACALDPTARLRVWELKGTGDLAALKHVAHEYGSGADRETLEACLASVRSYHGQLDPRAKTLRELPDDVRPENKVTPQLAAERRLGLFPDVLIIDEVQEAFGDKDLGSQFEELLTPVTKRGPALGMILVLATQRPDKKSLPTGISANIGIRFCLKVMSYIASNMVLGDGMSTQGYNAADFARSDKGIGWLTGEADDPMIVRGCYIDAPKADLIARRARQMRERVGTLSGFALGLDGSEASRSFAYDVLSIFGTDSRLWCETIAARLAEAIPGTYASITQDAVSSQLRALGVNVSPVREKGTGTRAGCRRSDVERVAGVQSDA